MKGEGPDSCAVLTATTSRHPLSGATGAMEDHPTSMERSTHFFLLEMGDRTDKVSMLRLKAARTPADTEPAKLLRRGRPALFAPPGCRTDSTSEPAAAEFGGDLWWRTICSYCVSSLNRHVTYYTTHMLYICRY
jgi:hypothetical protein